MSRGGIPLIYIITCLLLNCNGKLKFENDYSLKKIGGNDMDNNTPVYDFEEAINFISEKCDISRDNVEKVLMLEEDYMRSIGIISDESMN